MIIWIGQSDKYIDFTSARFDDFTWDYQEINSKLKEKIDFSKKFLDAAIRGENLREVGIGAGGQP